MIHTVLWVWGLALLQVKDALVDTMGGKLGDVHPSVRRAGPHGSFSMRFSLQVEYICKGNSRT